MLTLNSGAKAAYEARQITIESVLYVYNDSGVKVAVPPSALLNRPRRRLSPILDKSPVMRLDLDLVPSPAIRALFVEERKIEYQELVNGQLFDRFFGRIKKIRGGWSIENGAAREAVKVSCMSPSQALTDYEDEAVFTSSDGTLMDYWRLSCIFRYQPDELIYVVKGSGATSKDTLPSWVTMVVDPHGNGSGFGSEEKASATWYTSADPVVGATAYHGVDFNVIVDTDDKLKIEWLGTAARPVDGLEYALYLKLPQGFVIKNPKSVFTPSATDATALDAVNMGGVVTVEQVPASMCDYERGWSPRFCLPVIYRQLQGGTMDPQKNGDWQFQADRGILRYIGTKGMILATRVPQAGWVTQLGIVYAYALDPGSAVNEATYYLDQLYGRASIPSGTFEASGIAIAHGLLAGQGDEILRAYADNLPPNYVLYDDERGLPSGKLITQKGTADFKLRTLKALQSDEPPEKATLVRVWGSSEVVKRVAPNTGATAYPDGWDFPHRIKDGLDSTYATVNPASEKAWVEIQNNWRRRIREVKLKFQGRLELHLRSYRRLTPPGYVTPQFGYGGSPLSDVTAVFHATPQELVLTGFDQTPTRYGFNDQIFLDLHRTWGGIEGQMFECEVTFEEKSYGLAYLTNDPTLAATTGWQDVFVKLDNTAFAYQAKARYYSPAVLSRWMLAPTVADGSPPDPFYDDQWRHRVKDVEDPGFYSVLGNTLRDYATQYLDDLLRQAAAQQATVVHEPTLELGDTVEVDDVPSGSTYNALVIGFEDGGSWTAPSTTIYLTNFE